MSRTTATPTSTDAPLRIDIVSDVVCPWCIIGYRQLMIAAEQTGTAVDIHWHPFELNPNMPAEGQNLVDHVAEKYGTTKEESVQNRDRLSGLGKELGFDFAFKDDTRMHNTFNTHQLLHWAKEQNRGNDLKQALFTAHFTHNRVLSDDATLADIAADIGLDRDTALDVLSSQRYANDVRAQQQHWHGQGISGVPAMIFKGKYLVTGAQGVENYTNILNQLADMPGEPVQ